MLIIVLLIGLPVLPALCDILLECIGSILGFQMLSLLQCSLFQIVHFLLEVVNILLQLAEPAPKLIYVIVHIREVCDHTQLLFENIQLFFVFIDLRLQIAFI
jgi:hypothetical protein